MTTVTWIRCASALVVLSLVPLLNAAETDVLKAQQARVEVVRTAAPTVVAIFSADGNGGGSGVLISADGYALSNFHVTSATGEFMKCGLNALELFTGSDRLGAIELRRHCELTEKNPGEMISLDLPTPSARMPVEY